MAGTRLMILVAGLLMTCSGVARAQEGCYFGDRPHAGGRHASIEFDVRTPVLDVYVTRDFVDLDDPYGVDPGVALAQIRQWTQEVQPELGAAFKLRYRGIAEGVACCTFAHREAPGCGAFDRPTLIITGGVEGGNATSFSQPGPDGDMFCAQLTVQEQPPARCDAERFGPGGCPRGLDCASGLCRDDQRLRKMRMMLWHELMHMLRYHHQDELVCDGRWRDDASIVLRRWGADEAFERPTMADMLNVRSAYGLARHDVVRRVASGMRSNAWGEALVLEHDRGISPVSAADGDDHAEGYAWVARDEGTALDGRVRAAIFEGAEWTVYDVSGQPSMHRPVVARSKGQATDRWLVGFWAHESRNDPGSKYLYFREKSFGASTWSAGGALGGGSRPIQSPRDTRRNDGVGLTFDPVRARFVAVFLTADFRLAVATRPVDRVEWHPRLFASPGPATYWGSVDVACSPSALPVVEDNCVAIAQRRGSPTAFPVPEARAFSINADGSVRFGASWQLWTPVEAYSHASAVSIAVNPFPSPPRAVLGFGVNTLDVTDRRDNRLHTAALAIDHAAWIQVRWSPLQATSHIGEYWLRGPGLGTHVFGGVAYRQLAYARD